MVLQSATSPFTPEFDTLVLELLEEWKVPGLTIGIVHDSKTYSKAYGVAEFPNKKMTPDALFSTCSTTKAFTAAAMSLVIEETENKESPSPMTWTRPLASIIGEDFVLADEYATANTTVEDALSHRSGLPGHEAAMMLAHPDETLREEVRKLRALALASPPRQTFHYCNHMYMAVSYAYEKQTGQSLGRALKERFWDPLDMQNTYYDVREVRNIPGAKDKLVRGYTYAPERGVYVPEPHMNYVPTTGAGSMASNVLDYAKWVSSWIDRTGPMSSRGYEDLLTPRAVLTSADTDGIIAPPAPYHLYALGWFIDHVCGERLYWHSGSWPGFGIMVGFIPDRKWGFAMMGNAVDARAVEMELYMYLIERLVGGSSGTGDRKAGNQRGAERSEGERLGDAKNRLYPGLPDPPIPHALPLYAYTGVYQHPGYGSFELVLEDGILTADLMDRVERQRLVLEHASGEFFVGVLYTPERGRSLGEKFKTEFYVDVSGTAVKVGLDLEPALRGEKIWFMRLGV